MKKIWFIDIDGVICTNTFGLYDTAVPKLNNIKKVNKLFDDGNTVILWTARGTLLSDKRKGIKKLTKQQLKDWGVKYTELRFGKPYYDFIWDDRSVELE
jgi:hypothetical protein